jgi:hypothetical protein
MPPGTLGERDFGAKVRAKAYVGGANGKPSLLFEENYGFFRKVLVWG